MSTERDQYGVYHIDGPPVGGFAVVENPDGSGARIDVVYKTLCFYGTKEQCEEVYADFMVLVASQLQDLVGENPAKPVHPRVQSFPRLQPIIWWRKRKEIEVDVEDPGRWVLYCRLDTTPPLPVEIWERWGKKEGEMPKRAAEFV